MAFRASIIYEDDCRDWPLTGLLDDASTQGARLAFQINYSVDLERSRAEHRRVKWRGRECPATVGPQSSRDTFACDMTAECGTDRRSTPILLLFIPVLP